jgi:hypothetical protein
MGRPEIPPCFSFRDNVLEAGREVGGIYYFNGFCFCARVELMNAWLTREDLEGFFNYQRQ